MAPKGFCFFKFVHLQYFFLQKKRFTGPVANGNEMIQLLKMYLIQCDTIVTQCISCNKIQCIYNSLHHLGHLKLILSLLNFLNLFFLPSLASYFLKSNILIEGGGGGGGGVIIFN